MSTFTSREIEDYAMMIFITIFAFCTFGYATFETSTIRVILCIAGPIFCISFGLLAIRDQNIFSKIIGFINILLGLLGILTIIIRFS